MLCDILPGIPVDRIEQQIESPRFSSRCICNCARKIALNRLEVFYILCLRLYQARSTRARIYCLRARMQIVRFDLSIERYSRFIDTRSAIVYARFIRESKTRGVRQKERDRHADSQGGPRYRVLRRNPFHGRSIRFFRLVRLARNLRRSPRRDRFRIFPHPDPRHARMSTCAMRQSVYFASLIFRERNA